MRKLILLNREEIDIWVDPKLSNDDSPFEANQPDRSKTFGTARECLSRYYESPKP